MLGPYWHKKHTEFDDRDRALIKLVFGFPPRKEYERKGAHSCRAEIATSHPEIEHKIIEHQRRVLSEVPKKEPSVCWACGVPAPQTSYSPGWFCRWVKMTGFGKKEREMYCPRCFAEHGWPALPDTEEITC